MRLKKLFLTGTMAVSLSAATVASNMAGIGNLYVTDAAESDSTSDNSSSDSDSSSSDSSKSNKPSGDSKGTPPQKPDGDSNSDGSSMGTPPEKPDGDSSGTTGEAPSGEAPDGNGEASSGEAPDGNGEAPSGGAPGGANTQSFDYDGELNGTLTVDGDSQTSDGETIDATETDVNSVLVENGGTLEITNATLNKSGDDSSGDNCNFYGLNAILLTLNENSKTYISKSVLTAESEGSNAIFATDGGTVYAYDTSISTTSDSARGLDATYGGIIVADSMNITTQGEHCAALATDRGGGSVSVTGSTLNTNGSGSPLIYSTGDIEVSDVTGTATGSQIAAMEGLNTIIIQNSDLESTRTGDASHDSIANAFLLYQSMSGDADTSTGDTALCQATDSTLTSAIEEGAFFYITNTNVNVYLENNEISYDDSKANFITISGNDSNNWGSAGSNGATSIFTLSDQDASGNIEVDTISSLNFYVTNASTYTGSTTITTNTDATTEVENNLTVNVDEDSTWIVTADSTVYNLNVADGGQIVDENGNTVTIVAGDETKVEGSSDITITVTGNYSNTVELTEANAKSTDYIDRSEFDEYFGVSTSFAGASSNDVEEADDESNESVEETNSEKESESSTEAKDDSNKSENSSLWIAIVSGIAAIVVAAVGVFYAIKKPKKKE